MLFSHNWSGSLFCSSLPKAIHLITTRFIDSAAQVNSSGTEFSDQALLNIQFPTIPNSYAHSCIFFSLKKNLQWLYANFYIHSLTNGPVLKCQYKVYAWLACEFFHSILDLNLYDKKKDRSMQRNWCKRKRIEFNCPYWFLNEVLTQKGWSISYNRIQNVKMNDSAKIAHQSIAYYFVEVLNIIINVFISLGCWSKKLKTDSSYFHASTVDFIQI